MKLSILDQAPISSGQSAKEALNATVELAQHAERLGYERFWVAEHHDLYGLASPNPAVMLGIIGAQTEKIRIGAGAVLLPYYKPFHIAETYNLLETLYPERIDIGLGRAPGGSAEVSMALSDNYLEGVRHYPDAVESLRQFLHDDHPTSHTFHKINPTPIPDASPEMWVLGTSEKSALLAAEKGMYYSFADFMTDTDGPEIVQTYRDKFKENHNGVPYVIVAVNVICASTNEEAEKLAKSQFIWKLKQDKQNSDTTVPSVKNAEEYVLDEEEQEKVKKMKQSMVIGNPEYVAEQLHNTQQKYQADELMLITITHDKKAKQRSYTLIQEELKK